MSRSVLGAAVFAACCLLATEGSRVTQSVDSELNEQGNISAQLPSLSEHLPSLDSILRPDRLGACPAIAVGTMNVAIVSASGLKDRRSLWSVKPYYSILVSDQHSEGWQVAEHFTSSTRSGTTPKWGEAFSYQTRCPHLHSGFRLEMVVRDNQLFGDPMIGFATLPIEELIQKDGDRTVALEQGSGSLVLRTKWCPAGSDHERCMRGFTSSGMAVKGEALLECGQSCVAGMIKELSHVREQCEQFQRDVDVGEVTEEAKRPWEEVREFVDRWPRTPQLHCEGGVASAIGSVTARLQGPVQDVYFRWNMLNIRGSEVERVISQVGQVVTGLEEVKKKMDWDIMHEERMVADLEDKSIPRDCRESFRAAAAELLAGSH